MQGASLACSLVVVDHGDGGDDGDDASYCQHLIRDKRSCPPEPEHLRDASLYWHSPHLRAQQDGNYRMCKQHLV